MSSSSTRPLPCKLFSSRETLKEALDYSTNLIMARLGPAERSIALTALYVVLNTALKEINTLDLSSCLPYTDEEQENLAAFTVKDCPMEDVRRHIRTALPSQYLRVQALDKISSRIAAPHVVFTMLISKLFGLDVEDIEAELKALIAKED